MKLRNLAPIALLAALAAACADGGKSPTTGGVAAGGPTANLTGAVFTTHGSCTGTDLNIYAHKDSVYANGGPQNGNAAGLPDGAYYVQVTSPDGQLLGTSVGSANERPAHVTGGAGGGGGASTLKLSVLVSLFSKVLTALIHILYSPPGLGGSS